MYFGHRCGADGHGCESGLGFPITRRRDAKKMGLKRYFTGVPCKEGHLAERQTCTGHCVVCNLTRVKANYDPARKAIYSKNHYQKTAEQQRERCRQYHAQHKEERSAKRKQQRASSDAIRSSERRRTAERRATDLEFRIVKALRARLVSAIKRGTKSGSAIGDLGCSIDDFRKYIASKFATGMSWQNWPTEWHLDHIKPLASFDLTDRGQFLAACHYTNFQPLWVQEHRRKTARERYGRCDL